jgi:hypothetical protein
MNNSELQEKSNQEQPKSPERSFKEQRIREITFVYYSQPEIKKILFDFSINRETIPRYYEGFGKRPDSLQYEGDVLEHVKKGSTSFHCSEELWSDPLEISTEMSKPQFDELRIGWDLLIDIDSPYLEYSKIYTGLLIETLEFHNIQNYGIKFSGSKGFHIIIPWKAFPEQIYDQKTKNMFPEWPRIICQYLDEIIKPKLAERIFQEHSLKELAARTGKAEEDLVIDECISCKRPATKKYQVTWICNKCKTIGELIKIEQTKRIPKCPNEECRKPLIESSREEILFCEYCNFNSLKNPDMFQKSKEKTEALIEADLILVAPRHLFRMPYSLHEKTALASIVLNKAQVKTFQITDAKPFKNHPKNFYPNAKENEAKDLLLQALDWHEQKTQQEAIIDEKRQEQGTNLLKPNKSKKQGEFKKVEIPNPSPEIFPPQIQLILQGIKQDGRKRALGILIPFFKSLGVLDNNIEKRIFEWNEKNFQPLKKGYILSQLTWSKRNPTRMPYNFDNPIYKDLGVDKPDQLAMQTKNPVSYAVKKYFMLQRNKPNTAS